MKTSLTPRVLIQQSTRFRTSKNSGMYIELDSTLFKKGKALGRIHLISFLQQTGWVLLCFQLFLIYCETENS